MNKYSYQYNVKGAETNLYTFSYWLFSESIQLCFRTLYLFIWYVSSEASKKIFSGYKFFQTYKFFIIGQKCIVYKEQNCIVLQKKYVQNKDTKI